MKKWIVDVVPDANNAFTIREDDGSPHGNTHKQPIATVYRKEDAEEMVDHHNNEAHNGIGSRQQYQVNLLWPDKHSQYTQDMLVTFLPSIKTRSDAASELQHLYAGPHAIAGRFKVVSVWLRAKTYTVFKVRLFRDVVDDRKVVNDRLLEGRPFNVVLSQQIVREFRNAVSAVGHKIKRYRAERPPVFVKDDV